MLNNLCSCRACVQKWMRNLKRLEVLVAASGRWVEVQRGPCTKLADRQIIVIRDKYSGIVFNYSREGLKRATSYYGRIQRGGKS